MYKIIDSKALDVGTGLGVYRTGGGWLVGGEGRGGLRMGWQWKTCVKVLLVMAGGRRMD